jgi:mannosyltransferase
MLTPVRAGGAPVARAERPSRVTRIPSETWILVSLTVAAAVLRFATITSQSYWFDEAQAAHEMHLSFAGLIRFLVDHETNPPLYFVLGWVWTKLFGSGEAGLRSLSAIAGIAVVPIAYLCGRELVSRRAGLVAAALAAVSPFMIWYSQEAREYMLLAALSGTSLFWFARALRTHASGDIGRWALFAALAVLTHSFAGFLVAPELLWLLYVVRCRASVIAAAAVAAVQLALLPLLFTHATHSLLGFIKATSLTLRLEQVPVGFALGALYRSSLVNYGLLGAAVMAAVLILLIVVGADRAQLRGAGIAAALAGIVLLVPLGLALVGLDYYIVRALIPAWIPLAVVIGAACTAPGMRVWGSALAAVVIAAMVYGQIRIQSDSRYQRPDWRAVAATLGTAPAPRAIVVYDGLGTDPLATYLPGVPWNTPSSRITVSEVDVVGSSWLSPAPGARVIASKTVDGYLVVRFALTPPWTATTKTIAERAATQLSDQGVLDAPVLVQGTKP